VAFADGTPGAVRDAPRVSGSTHLRLSGVLTREALGTPVVLCPVDAGLRGAAALMARRRVGVVVVATAERPPRRTGHPTWSVVTDRDLAAAAVDVDAGEHLVDLAAPTVTVDVDDDLAAVGARLVAGGTSYAVVVDGGRPVGVVSVLDIVGALVGTGCGATEYPLPVAGRAA
jgi:CBS domain-containing protein